jgi:uncharacterized cupin superfamily protein
MPDNFTHFNLNDVEDSAPKFGFEEVQEARFANEELASSQLGMSKHYVKPGCRQGFGHWHEEAEEVYVVLAGSGRINLGGEVIALRERDTVRVDAPVVRAFEADDDGLEILAVGPLRSDDKGDLKMGWWG